MKLQAAINMLSDAREESLYLAGGERVYGKKAIIDNKTRYVHTVVSDNYKLLNHNQILTIVAENLDKLNEKYNACVDVDPYQSRMKAEFIFDGAKVPVSNVGDFISPSIIIKNSVDGSWALSMEFGARRLVCTNGMTVTKEFMNFKQRHVPNLDSYELEQLIETGHKSVKDIVPVWNKWCNTLADPKETKKQIETFNLNKTETKDLLDVREVESKANLDSWFCCTELDMKYEISVTQWVLFNIFTQFKTHCLNSMEKQESMDRKLRALYY